MKAAILSILALPIMLIAVPFGFIAKALQIGFFYGGHVMEKNADSCAESQRAKRSEQEQP